MVETLNATGIRPVEYKVLVKLDPVEEVTSGGIIRPDMRKERDQEAQTYATFIEAGGNAFEDWNGSVPKPGDRIVIKKYSGEYPSLIEIPGGEDAMLYRLCHDKDIVAIIE